MPDKGKQLKYDAKARGAILAGVEKLSRTVKTTLGPAGRNVILDKKWGKPTITKDGVTVAKEIELPDPFENMGAQMVREVASKTSDVAGDGTTTATLLAEMIYRQGLKNVTAGANPMVLQRGIQKAVDLVVAEIAKQNKKVKEHKEIAQVATISANGETKIGEIIADAMDKVGKDGTITVEDAKTHKGNYGHNVEMRKYGDLVEDGVLDPAKVVRCALQNAASIAGLMLTAECMVTEVPEKENRPAGRGAPDYGDDMDE